MLSESEVVPSRRPWKDAPTGSDTAAWVNGFTDQQLAPGGALHQAFANVLAWVTPEIVTPFLRQPPVPSWMPFRWFIDNGNTMAFSQIGRGPEGWSGIYRPPTVVGAGSVATAAGIAVRDQDWKWAAETAIHEFGHHIDFTWGRLWPGATGTPTQREYALSQQQSGSGLWAHIEAAWPSIPSALYGKVSYYEWFAEAFACQIVPSYRSTDPTNTQAGAILFYQLCGFDTARARAVRALFKQFLPMPPGFAYD